MPEGLLNKDGAALTVRRLHQVLAFYMTPIQE
jgi:hypothetical protein